MRQIDGFDRVVVARCADLTMIYTPPVVPWEQVRVLLTPSERALIAQAA